jgi:hypothetical protein
LALQQLFLLPGAAGGDLEQLELEARWMRRFKGGGGDREDEASTEERYSGMVRS